jgi:alpha-2-macroglobulin
VKRDDRPDASVIVKGTQGPNDAVIGTAHWGEDGVYWRWSDGGVEATAFALRAMLAIDPKNRLIEPVTNWLVKNRRGAQWSNTRDTAIVVLAMNDYLRVSGELSANIEYELLVNGNSIATKKLSAEDALGAPSRFAIEQRHIKDGVNEIRIVRKNAQNEAPIYFSAEATYFSTEEPVSAAGNEIFTRRDYYKLVPRPTLLKGYVYDRLPLRDGEAVKSGERIEVVMTVEAKNNYEYLVFEDLKPAGLEAVEVRSGNSVFAKEMKSGAVAQTFGDAKKTNDAVTAEQAHGDAADYTGRSRWVYQELRDRKVALFLDRLPEGVWEIRYSLRAETPGKFHALPVLGHAMYVPEIRCNSQEIRISVTE